MDQGADYADFIRNKLKRHPSSGHEPSALPSLLFGFQRDLVAWSLRKGRAAIFADTGLGKTFMQAAWAADVLRETGGPLLIIAPLAVSRQTVVEAKRLGVEIKLCSALSDFDRSAINITNYERMERFELESLAGVVLDESSILKAHDSKTRNKIIDRLGPVRYKLACTATPAPNDHMELGNHAEFVGAMTRSEMLAMFFCHDGGETQKWRLKGHAQDSFWRWMASWGAFVRKPSDLGYSDDGFVLPELRRHDHVISVEERPVGGFFPSDRKSLMERRRARRGSLDLRVARAVELVAEKPDDQWLVWCDLNDESAALARCIPGAVEVKGADPSQHKERSMLRFAAGDLRVLVSKPSICGFGMNFQACSNMVFVGLSDSFEQLYQAIRRCWRFGQTRPVDVHVITASSEGAVLANIARKEKEAKAMGDFMAEHVGDAVRDEVRGSTGSLKLNVERQVEGTDAWTMILGDCVEEIRRLDADSIDYSIFSPPFSSLYTYTDSARDMGNCDGDGEFFEHFGFLVPELLRVIKPGRLCSVHCMNIPTSKVREGYIGIRDFRGDLIRAFQREGWIYHSEVVIRKDPVTAMQRTKALGLLHKTIRKDSSMARMGIPDYVLTFRKSGENREPIPHDSDEFPVSLWQRWAEPVWTDINPSDTLQKKSAREEKDERHIAPLQLEVIRRCLGLWTNEGDLVLSPFAGIGSEGYESVLHGRRFLGFELKLSYWIQACANLKNAENSPRPLFSPLAGNKGRRRRSLRL